ncbi:MAG: DNA-protecting protein DprA [Pedobacter sp.]|nr:MAG: DNA-protecting protein DprA [Pedobacter sp.]
MKGKEKRNKRIDVIFAMALTLIKGLGPRQGRILLDYFGSAEAIFSASLNTLKGVEGLNVKLPELILTANTFKDAAAHLLFAKKHAIQVISILDEEYPQRLKNCEDAPLVIYVKGAITFNQKRVIAVVGTRLATAYGKSLCSNLVKAFKNSDTLIVSGLAFGIDITAHQAALEYALPTVGVLGQGLDSIYPVAHTNIAHKMLLNGGLLSEFLPGTPAKKENFPQRNRIIAGMCDALVVVEAAIKGGALISAELANAYNREVFAFSGRSNDRFSAGCNFLIKTHKAALINSADDLIYAMGWETASDLINEKEAAKDIELNAQERIIYNLIQNKTQHIDELFQQSGIPASDLALILINFELQGVILALPGNFYQMA